ncbi:MAG: hypothetical protein Q4G59_12520 [Planctomycetia bacterium]|nr:hypothetical protein [Planctomycetia bacterium]
MAISIPYFNDLAARVWKYFAMAIAMSPSISMSISLSILDRQPFVKLKW